MKIKKKLKDLTIEDWKNWKKFNCLKKDCSNCIFKTLGCYDDVYTGDEYAWVNNKEIFNKDFLNLEVEIEAKDILDKVEKEYLENVLRPFKNRKIKIRKDIFCNNEYEYILINIKCPASNNYLNYECITMPCFKKGKMYRNMELNKEYTLKELGLFNGDK